MNNEKKSNKWTVGRLIPITVWSLLAIATLVGCIVFYYYNNYFSGPITSNHEKWGQFGDFIGGVLNPLIAFCALIALIIAVILQRSELRDAKDQFANQATDNVFFQMLKLHNDIVDSLYAEGKPNGKSTVYRGRETFVFFHDELIAYFPYTKRDDDKTKNEYFTKLYMKLYNEFQSQLGHYFRYLYNIFKFLNSDNVNSENKIFFSKLVRSQLSNYELSILFYNCLSEHGNKKFKPLVEKFALFKNLPPDLLLDKSHYRLYAKEAWGENFEKVKTECESAF